MSRETKNSLSMTPTIVFSLPIGMTLGGANTWSIEVAGHLAKRGHRVALIEHTCVDWHPRMDIPIPDGVQHVLCPGPTPVAARKRHIHTYAKVYRDLLPAVLIPNFSAPLYATCALLAQEQPEHVRILGVCHGHADSYTSLLRYYESAITLFLAKNEPMRKALREMLPGRSADVLMKPYAVNVPENLDRHYATGKEPLRLAYAGRITDHEKRVSNLIPLARLLGERKVNFELRIIGEGGYKEWLCHEVNELPSDSQKRIIIVGGMLPDQLMDVWGNTDVCLLVSNTESGGISMLEAMAQGCVGVATRCHGPSLIIDEREENGFLVDIDDMEAMAQRIAELDKDRLRLEQMGTQAYEIVRKEYSYEQYVPWFEEQMTRIWQAPPASWGQDRKLLPRGYRPAARPKRNISVMTRIAKRLFNR